MADEYIGLTGIGLLLFLLVLRVPIAVALIVVATTGIWVLLGERPALGLLVSVPYDFIAKWTLSSVPMFLLMGYVCYHAGLTKGLFDAGRIWLSRLPGGLAVASVVGSAGFAAVCGSSIASAAAMGRIAIPEMMSKGYEPALATGTVAAAGTLGALIPPSIILILFGIFAEVPIGQLFLGGVGAGLLTALSYVIVIVVRTSLNPGLAPQATEAITAEAKRKVLYDTWPTLLLVLCVLGGLFSGLFTATEAGAVGAVTAVLIAFGKQSFSWSLLWQSTIETLSTTAALFLIAVGANLLTRFLSLSGATELISQTVLIFGSNELALLFGIAVVYLLLGMFLEPIGAMLLTLPVMLPVVSEAGINLVWFGVFVCKLLEVGMITPPIGLNVFVIKGVVGNEVPLGTIFRGILPFLVVDLVVLVLMVAIPQTIVFLPELLQ